MAKCQNERRICNKQWIDNQLYGSSVTVVLIGAETCQRKFVRYEVEKSFYDGKGVLGIFIHHMKNEKGLTDNHGYVNLADIFSDPYKRQLFNYRFRTYDWILENGRFNIGEWIERAARAVGK
jgi:hypothetical protein